LSEPKKDQIAEAVVTALQGVTVGAGYWTDLGLNVSRRRLVLNEWNQTQLPAASVWCGDSAPSPVMCTGSYRERVDVLVEVIYRSEEREHLDRDGIRCEADVKQAVLATNVLDMVGTVTRLAPAAVSADHQEFTDDHLGRRLVAFEVDYNYTALAP
jgi:hypothetical protein